MIAGDRCTRACGFCAVDTRKPMALEVDEPDRVAEATRRMKLKHVVITSVNRDDLPDGGAKIFSECILESRLRSPNCTVEVLIPDLEGNWKALKAIVEARPDVLNHNTETVPRIYRRIRPRADYKRTLELLRLSKEMAPKMLTKSGLMVGLGENTIELLETIQDIRNTNCDLLTIGQYLSPSKKHFDVDYYYTPEEFEQLKTASLKMGFRHVESGPLVRSSYHARQQAQL